MSRCREAVAAAGLFLALVTGADPTCPQLEHNVNYDKNDLKINGTTTGVMVRSLAHLLPPSRAALPVRCACSFRRAFRM